MQGELFTTEQADVHNLLPKDGEVYLYPYFFSKEECDRYFSTLLNTVEWQQDSMKFYGRTVNLPRLTAWYGDTGEDYSYSGIDMHSKPWLPELLEIKSRIEEQSGFRFNTVLLNYYRMGTIV